MIYMRKIVFSLVLIKLLTIIKILVLKLFISNQIAKIRIAKLINNNNNFAFIKSRYNTSLINVKNLY
jgi:hypothetical protein